MSRRRILSKRPNGALAEYASSFEIQFNAVVGLQRSFAETVNAYIEKKLTEE